MLNFKTQSGFAASLFVFAIALSLVSCSESNIETRPRIESFTAIPATITQGETSRLTWTVTGDAPMTLSLDHGVGDVTGQTASEVRPATTTSYTLTATNRAGEVSDTATVTVGTPQACADPVAIPDTNLEQAVRDALGKPSGTVTCAEMGVLIELQANERGISTLEGLQFATALRVLELDDNAISDLSPLANLVELRAVFLQRNNVRDVSPLAGLTNLVALFLSENAISDLSPLANLTATQYFFVSDNPVGNIDVVKNYDSLIELGAARTGLADLGPIVGKSLTYLWLNNNAALEDFSAISSMTTLEALLVGDTGFDDDDMPLLANKSSLQRLQLWANEGVSDISVIKNLSQLTQEIDLGGTSVSDLSPLYGFTRLKQLRLYNLGLTSTEIDFVRNFSQLEVLYLTGNELTDIGVLVRNSGIDNGDTVNVSDNLLNLNDPSVQADIQALLARGVDITFEPQNTRAP